MHTHRTYVSYIDDSRAFYAAQGYARPYRWARHDEVGLTRLDRPVAESRVGVVTTAGLAGEPVDEPWSAPVEHGIPALRTEHLSWHKTATTTDDPGSFLPVVHLDALRDQGRIGSQSPRLYGTPTLYSRRRVQANARQLADELAADGVDAALLVPL